MLKNSLLMGGLLSTALCLLTVVWPEWIEQVSGASPDYGSGILERGAAAGLMLLAVILFRQSYALPRSRTHRLSDRSVMGGN